MKARLTSTHQNICEYHHLAFCSDGWGQNIQNMCLNFTFYLPLWVVLNETLFFFFLISLLMTSITYATVTLLSKPTQEKCLNPLQSDPIPWHAAGAIYPKMTPINETLLSLQLIKIFHSNFQNKVL